MHVGGEGGGKGFILLPSPAFFSSPATRGDFFFGNSSRAGASDDIILRRGGCVRAQSREEAKHALLIIRLQPKVDRPSNCPSENNELYITYYVVSYP